MFDQPDKRLQIRFRSGDQMWTVEDPQSVILSFPESIISQGKEWTPDGTTELIQTDAFALTMGRSQDVYLLFIAIVIQLIEAGAPPDLIMGACADGARIGVQRRGSDDGHG